MPKGNFSLLIIKNGLPRDQMNLLPGGRGIVKDVQDGMDKRTELKR